MHGRSKERGALDPRERALLEELVRECGPRLLAFVRRSYGLMHDAEDIVAETFCRAAQNMAAVRASERQDLYLLIIARNLCRDRFRRRCPKPMSPEHLEEFVRPVDSEQPLAATEQKTALRAAVARLPEGMREVVVLRLATNLKFEEIAALLHVPLGTVLSRMHAAVQCLKETLASRL